MDKDDSSDDKHKTGHDNAKHSSEPVALADSLKAVKATIPIKPEATMPPKPFTPFRPKNTFALTPSILKESEKSIVTSKPIIQAKPIITSNPKLPPKPSPAIIAEILGKPNLVDKPIIPPKPVPAIKTTMPSKPVMTYKKPASSPLSNDELIEKQNIKSDFFKEVLNKALEVLKPDLYKDDPVKKHLIIRANDLLQTEIKEQNINLNKPRLSFKEIDHVLKSLENITKNMEKNTTNLSPSNKIFSENISSIMENTAQVFQEYQVNKDGTVKNNSLVNCVKFIKDDVNAIIQNASNSQKKDPKHIINDDLNKIWEANKAPTLITIEEKNIASKLSNKEKAVQQAKNLAKELGGKVSKFVQKNTKSMCNSTPRISNRKPLTRTP